MLDMIDSYQKQIDDLRIAVTLITKTMGKEVRLYSVEVIKIPYSSDGVEEIFHFSEKLLGWIARLEVLEFKMNEVLLFGKVLRTKFDDLLSTQKAFVLQKNHSSLVGKGCGADERELEAKLSLLDEHKQGASLSCSILCVENMKWQIINKRKLFSELVGGMRILKDLLDTGIRLNEITSKGD